MSLLVKNVELRNLQEQVQKNKEDIAKHYEIDRTLANFGIKIVGQVEIPEDLPDPLTYTGEYGDGYVVGIKNAVEDGVDTYSYYIFTRPDPNAGYAYNHWLDVGKLGIKGDTGAQGPEGPVGPAGPATKWWVLPSVISGSTVSADVTKGDFAISASGDVFVATQRDSGILWIYFTNIKGPQGIQGPIGPQGEQGIQGPRGERGFQGIPGRAVNIQGIFEVSTQLPDPASLNDLTIGYLVGTSGNYELYIQVGTASSSALWENLGDYSTGTQLFDGAEPLQTWNVDDVVLKNKTTTTTASVYGRDANSTDTINFYLYNNPVIYGIPRYNARKTIKTDIPTQTDDCANKEYVDNLTNNFIISVVPTTTNSLGGTFSYEYGATEVFTMLTCQSARVSKTGHSHSDWYFGAIYDKDERALNTRISMYDADGKVVYETTYQTDSSFPSETVYNRVTTVVIKEE